MATEVRQRPVGHSADCTDNPTASSEAVAVDRSAAIAESCSQQSASVSTSLGQEGAFVLFVACLADISKDPHNSRMLNIHFNGAFPYPILNKLPWPAGFIAMATTSIVVFYMMFLAGRQLCKTLLLKRAKVE
ncbi:hypothetical protein WJX79_000299 [Trebouxia sp. C0005]